MEPILRRIKTLVEVDIADDIFDPQLLHYCNGGLQYLINNAIPVTLIDNETVDWPDIEPGDDNIVIAWLHFYVVQRFDGSLMAVTSRGSQIWIDGEMNNLIYQLKARYDI